MTKIKFRFTKIGKDSTVGYGLKRYVTPENYDLIQRGDWIDAEIWESPQGFLTRLTAGGSPILLYGASTKERVIYGDGAHQATAGIHGFGEGVVFPVLSSAMTTNPWYFGDRSRNGPGRGDGCREAGCQNVYVAEENGGYLRLSRHPDRIAYDFAWFHGAYERTATTPTAWAYQEEDPGHPETSLRTEVRSVVEIPDHGVPDWQSLVPKGIVLMTTDGHIGYALPGANGAPPDVRFEKQNQFRGFREAAESRTTQQNVILGGLIAATLVAAVVVARSILKARRAR